MSEITFRSDVSVELLELLGDEQTIVRSARVSTKGESAEKAEADGLIRYLWRHGHGTPFEYPQLHFRITAPKHSTIQILKHRLSTINEESMRYREFNPTFYVPGEERPVVQVGKVSEYKFEYSEEKLRIAQKAHEAVAKFSWDLYQEQLEAGVAQEVARGVLPLNIYSSLIISMNLRSWINFVKLRTTDYGSNAQYEINQVGQEVKAVLEEHFPTVMGCVNEDL